MTTEPSEGCYRFLRNLLRPLEVIRAQLGRKSLFQRRTPEPCPVACPSPPVHRTPGPALRPPSWNREVPMSRINIGRLGVAAVTFAAAAVAGFTPAVAGSSAVPHTELHRAAAPAATPATTG